MSEYIVLVHLWCIGTIEGHRESFISHRNYEQPDSFDQLYIKEENIGWPLSNPIQSLRIYYHERRNLPVTK